MTRFKDTEIVKYLDRVIALEGKESEVFKLVLDNRNIKDLIIFLNTEDQLMKDSIDSAGNRLTNRFSGSQTYSLFDPKGRGGKPYELFDTGEYYDSFRVEFGDFVIQIFSDPQKEDNNLFEMFGAEIEGLTQENMEVLIKEALKNYRLWYDNNILPQ